MKLRILAIMLLLGGVATAQNPYIALEGVVNSDSGVSISLAQTTLAVDVTVERRQVISGPYARYAQKYLGVRAQLADKDSWSVKGAAVAIVEGTSHIAVTELPAATSKSESHAVSAEEFASLQPDKLDMAVLSLEDSARAAAERIFSLRRHRLELITGEAGEGVFGAGLDAALKEIERQEQSYLELFFGKHITSTLSQRYIVHPDVAKRQYIVCRFSPSAGLLPAADLSGEVVLLQIDPSAALVAAGLEAGAKDANIVKCRVADPSTCTVSCQGVEYASVVLPIFEFGRTINVSLGRGK